MPETVVGFLGSSSLSTHYTFVFWKSRLSNWVQRGKEKKEKKHKIPISLNHENKWFLSSKALSFVFSL